MRNILKSINIINQNGSLSVKKSFQKKEKLSEVTKIEYNEIRKTKGREFGNTVRFFLHRGIDTIKTESRHEIKENSLI